MFKEWPAEKSWTDCKHWVSKSGHCGKYNSGCFDCGTHELPENEFIDIAGKLVGKCQQLQSENHKLRLRNSELVFLIAGARGLGGHA